jgi:hypothetical protein
MSLRWRIAVSISRPFRTLHDNCAQLSMFRRRAPRKDPKWPCFPAWTIWLERTPARVQRGCPGPAGPARPGGARPRLSSPFACDNLEKHALRGGQGDV